ncbi:MAG: glucose-1-phosphate adenylyltransferase [Anaerolineales bacterium]|nr:glucose-1-phosphate adenylyltransferase [Anaerolineales bacterium]
MPALNDTLAVVMGGGRGQRLYPLTKLRSKPAVPIAGKYRLIDIPISNCINSGIYRIAVLTQFNSHSLHRHITQAYNFDTFHIGWVQIFAAEQTPDSADWYQGTADAVRKQLFQIKSSQAEYVLILAGDHLYRMDYSEMFDYHCENKADVTVAVQSVAKSEATRLGLLKKESDGRISAFVEKPKDPAVQKQFVSRNDKKRPFLASMGIYLFNTDVLVDVLNQYPDFDDFGGDVLPHAIGAHSVYGFDFEGYWRDIGTIRSFYETNLELTVQDPPFNFHDSNHPIYTHARFLPGSSVEDSRLKDVVLAEGCLIQKSEISHSVVGVRSVISAGTKVRDSILMGADYFTDEAGGDPALPAIGVGPNGSISGAIIDKNARIGANVTIKPFPPGTDIVTENWTVQDGIVVIPKNAIIFPGTRIEPGK